MITAARPINENGSHFYTVNGKPLYEVEKKDGSGLRPFTLADARKMDPKPLPSVTTILSILHKEALVNWRIENACLAVLTTPQMQDEPTDAFVERVLHTERQQDQESDIAKRRGIEIHDAIEDYFNGRGVHESIIGWIDPVIGLLKSMGVFVHSEHILVGVGYAGKCDLILTDKHGWEWIADFKTTRKLPAKESYWEHRMQTAAYLKCRPHANRHANIYISTVNQGEFVFHDNGDYSQPYEAFEALRDYWQIANNYRP